MRKFITRSAFRQAHKSRIKNETLAAACDRASDGLVDAEIGAHLYKQRVGRKGDYRVILFLKRDERAVVLHIFPKNVQPNITGPELSTLRDFARILADLSDADFAALADTQNWKDLSDEPPEKDL